MIPEQPMTEQPEGGMDQFEEELESMEVQLGEGQQSQVDAYRDNATIAIFSEESQPAILQSLQSEQDPVKAVAVTAFGLHKQMENSLEKSQQEKMSEITLLLGASHLVSELITLAEAAGLYKLDETQKLDAFRVAMEEYFASGLNDGTIDPIELQKAIEPLMTNEQRQAGLQAMDQSGISKTVPPPPGGLLNRGR